MAWYVSPGEDASVHRRMKRLDTPVQLQLKNLSNYSSALL